MAQQASLVQQLVAASKFFPVRLRGAAPWSQQRWRGRSQAGVPAPCAQELLLEHLTLRSSERMHAAQRGELLYGDVGAPRCQRPVARGCAAAPADTQCLIRLA